MRILLGLAAALALAACDESPERPVLVTFCHDWDHTIQVVRDDSGDYWATDGSSRWVRLEGPTCPKGTSE